MNPIRLETWAKEIRMELAEFVRFWKAGHKESKEDYPLELLAGDWNEQFTFWCESNK